jgi:alginate O-acetyltransferase complex protein AlgI
LLFNSLEFFAFLAIVYTLYRLLPMRGQNWLLLAAGYVFYGWWDLRFLFLIAFSTTVDFWIGLMLGERRVPMRQRVTASAFLIGAAVLTVCVDWRAIGAGDFAGAMVIPPLGAVALAAAVTMVVLANLSHGRIAAMKPEQARRLLVFATVLVNLGFLATFKYFNFFIDSAHAALTSIGFTPDRFHLEVILPVGISFYTFQSLSYTLDASRGLIAPARRFWDFALFVAFFPPMAAGPIERARHLLPQLLQPRQIRLDQSVHGVLLILLGLFKKVAIADGLAVPVNAVFNSTGAVSSTDVALATLLFAFQILCDFSAYTDIARGVSKMLGFELVSNFNLPYFSQNPSEFWRRWHISLSSWLRDYLYIPLGGSRRGEKRTYANLMTTMTLGGLWHGAAWNFVLWGLYHGALLCGHRLLTGGGRMPATPEVASKAEQRVPEYVAVLGTACASTLRMALLFLFVCYGWLLFRAQSFDQVVTFTQLLAGFGPSAPSVMPRPPLSALVGLAILIALQIVEYRDGRPECFRHWRAPVQGALYAVIIFVLAMGTSNAPVQFIYFQF